MKFHTIFQKSLLISFFWWGNVAFSEGVSLSYERFIRLNTPSKTAGTTNWFGMNIDLLSKKKSFTTRLDLDLRYFNNEKENNINYSLSEASVSFIDAVSDLTIGRTILNFNPSEKYWQLGAINGQQGFKLLSEKQEGLIGLHYKYRPKKKGFRYSVFLSYIYLPSLNPNMKIDNGKVTSSSEWRVLPPTQTRLEGRTLDIDYELERPAVADIIFQKTLGSSLEYSWGSGKILGYALYKPENKIRANALAYYDLSSDKVIVIAKPIVNHHATIGASLHQKVGHVKLVAGLDVIDPNAKLGKDFEILNPLQLQEQNKTFESEYFKIAPQYDRESYVHGQALLDFSHYSLSINYIQLVSSNVRKSDDFFSDTVKFKRALGTQLKFSLFDKWSLLLDYKYDIRRSDSIVRGESVYRFKKSMTLGLGIEMIKAPDENSFWSSYRANDTVYTSFKYHF